MESPRKFNDCYFYYYSTCTKGDNCVFRHEPSALGCETMCTAWQQGKCLDKRCKLRHMELRKNRKQIPCYWENQPGGCRKMHCPFMHKNPDARTDGIAPSQPAPVPAPSVAPGGEPAGPAEPQMSAAPAPAPAPAPVPLLWQQQRQEHLPPVVLDSSMLGVLPAPSELRRMLAPHAHAHAPAHAHAHAPAHAHEPAAPYAPLPVDPLVVNFEEESDNESAPSSAPTAPARRDDAPARARSKSHELLLLERIQAEAAAFYNYDALPPPDPAKDRKIVRSNLSTKYDRLSLDEISGKKKDEERRAPLDFKVLSLDEIRAKKKDVVHPPAITLNLSNRKRKLSTQETVTTTGEKIIKVVRSNSIVYKQLDRNTTAISSQAKIERKRSESENRKRTVSEHSDILEVHEDELVDNCFEFKRIKIVEPTAQNKPRLIRNRNISENKDNDKTNQAVDIYKADNDSDSEVQIVSVEMSNGGIDIDLDKIYDSEVIDVDSTRISEPIDIVDLSEDADESDVTASDLHLDLTKNVPDVVASCHMNTNNFHSSDKRLMNDDLSIM